MKTTELMISDWVQITPETTEAYDVEIPKKAIMHQVNSYDMLCFAEGGLDPIELTTEILKKNGFHYVPRATPHWYNEIVDVIILEEQGTTNFYTQILSICTTVKYVHEFQHLLRFCGLNDFANNLEI